MTKTTLLCYAPQDERMVEKLKNHLSSLVNDKLITLWDYGSISPGAEWALEMDTYLKQAHIILLLISSDFLASHYCYRVQMQEAIRRHERKEARVIPVILRSVHWERPPLDKLQPLPSQGKPICEWRNRDKGYTNVAEGIAKVIEQWNIQNLPDPITKRLVLMAKLNQLIETVKVQMQPPPRASATANTLSSLQQLSIFTPTDATLEDLEIGWRTLSRSSQSEEEIAISQRRVTCAELANMASQFTTGQGNLSQAIKTWGIWRDAFQKSDDPRQQAMAKTFDREVTELCEAAR